MNHSLQAYLATREALLLEIIQTLLMDERFVAAWLTGSLGRQDADAVSDLDLSVVVSNAYSDVLCARPEQVSAQTTKERLGLFSKFGQPVVIHENHQNAPEGGTFTFVLYQSSALMVDWILIPHTKAQRPPHSRLLFDQVNVPVSPETEPESLAQRAKMASNLVAFFWMMAAVTAKNMIRRNDVFVTCWLEELHRMLRELDRLIAGETWQYLRGSIHVLEPTHEGQINALKQLCDRMSKRMLEVAMLGGHVLPSPMPTIDKLLSLCDGA